ncbi:hypothetical protein F5Y15DRAFT_183167 [Xylariaceae sp. FL0016]|nr:hypothetical protein F5Y15DRAFT_183167 [Xylariaceae sp. FL0016]
MAEPRKKGFWSGLLSRTRSNAGGNGDGKLERSHPRRVSEGDVVYRRHPSADRPGPSNNAKGRGSTRRRPRRPEPRDAKGKGRAQANGNVYEASPLTEWPPSGVSSEEELTLGHAMELVSRGVPAHRGHRRPITHAPDHYYGLYATSAGNHRGDETDAADPHDAMTQLMTIRVVRGSGGPPDYPWETLEQPSLAFGIGALPGTITLNAWVSRSSAFPPAIALRDPGVAPREVELRAIFERLRELEAGGAAGGLDDESEDGLYGLYRRFLRDPDKIFSPHKRMEQQITDLVMCLSGPDWIDFTVPKNQVVTKFVYDTGGGNQEVYARFFYQLLLSLELDLRINSRQHLEEAKERLVGQIPPKIQWSLALARRWRDYVRVDKYGDTPEEVRLRFKLRKRQGKMLKRFAQMMKWPNLNETLEALRQRDADGTLVSVSSHAMAFFSGLVLPGPSFPFLMMNSLIDIDPDKATDELAMLTHLYPHCGFQYRNSYTYWTSTSIVGKVLAPTCLDVAGWVGPARPTSDLSRSQIARIRARKSRQRLTPEDVASMGERSDPLGPAAEVYPVKEYELFTPDMDETPETVRIELLNLKALTEKDGGPQWFDASLQFAIDGVSWPLRLNYDVSFIYAWPCSEGPHPLFFDYVYTAVKADEVVHIFNWGRPEGGSGDRSAQSTPVGGSRPQPKTAIVQGDDAERVLVVEAFGVPDNEVLVRAWCAHWGLNAVVAEIGKTCMACAIREAYAATLTVVILVEGEGGGGE